MKNTETEGQRPRGGTGLTTPPLVSAGWSTRPCDALGGPGKFISKLYLLYMQTRALINASRLLAPQILQQTTKQSANMAAATASTLLPLAIQAGQAIASAVRARRSRRATSGGSARRPSRRTPRRGGTNPQRRTRAPVAVGTRSTQRNAPTTQRMSATEQFDFVHPNDALFQAYAHNTDITDELAFPRLSQVAPQYQKFACGLLTYTYTPTVGTGTNGTVYLGFEPDVNANMPTSAEQMRGLYGTVSGPIWQNLRLSVPVSALNSVTRNPLIRGPVTATDNLNNLGRFIYAVEGSSVAKINVGYLAVTYSMTLMQPRTQVGGATLAGPITMTDGEYVTSRLCPLAATAEEDAEFPLTKRTRCPLLLIVGREGSAFTGPIVANLSDERVIDGIPAASARNVFLIPLPFGVYDLDIDLAGGTFSTAYACMVNPASAVPEPSA